MPYCRKHVYLPSGAVTLCSVALSGEDKEALRRMDTATTVPSVGLECHLFMVKLLGDHDFADRENPHDEILEWITKMKSWCNGTLEFINDLDVGVQPIFKELVQLIDQRQELVHEFQAFKASQEIRIQEEKGYTAMLSRQEVQSAKRGDSEQMIEKKQNLLKGWKQDKMDTIERETAAKQGPIEKLCCEIHRKMDAVIDVAQLDPMDHDPVHEGADDAIMAELEQLMSAVSIAGSADDGSSLVQHQKTLILGDTDSVGDATMGKPVVPMFQDAQTPPDQLNLFGGSQQDQCVVTGVAPGSSNTPTGDPAGPCQRACRKIPGAGIPAEPTSECWGGARCTAGLAEEGHDAASGVEGVV